MTVSNTRAASAIFVAHNQSIENLFAVDLHGHHVAEALALVERNLATLDTLRSRTRLKLICGRGSHSQGGQPAILPAVKARLEALRVRYEEEPGGNLLVRLRHA